MKNRDSLFPLFAPTLLTWYESNKRDLPWRHSKDPYTIWLSEVILQQTRVEQGLPYYRKFLEKFPSVESLALASEDEVFKLWQGLGYYSRARNLHTTAKMILVDYKGIFPSQYKEVLDLKGIGEYTAAAIMSFAYDEPYAVLDGNVYRVLSRMFGLEEYIDTSAGKKIFSEIASNLLCQENPATYNQAIMDFGAMQCIPTSPDCHKCPFVQNCYAFNYNSVSSFPRKKGKVKVRHRYFNYLDIRVGNFTFLKKREENDIWRGLYEFPLIETEADVPIKELIEMKEFRSLMSDSETVSISNQYTTKHVLSHQIIHGTFYQIHIDQYLEEPYLKVEKGDVELYAVSKMINNYLNYLD